MAERKVSDWDRIECEYRAGIRTITEIAKDHGITHSRICVYAKKHGWQRDLRAKTLSKAEAKLAQRAANVDASIILTEEQVVEANAEAIAAVRLSHRSDILRLRNLSRTLAAELEQADSTARRISGLKNLADALSVLIKLEREAWGLASIPDKPPADPVVDPMEGARRLAFALARAVHEQESKANG